jgi:hypothetical protein
MVTNSPLATSKETSDNAFVPSGNVIDTFRKDNGDCDIRTPNWDLVPRSSIIVVAVVGVVGIGSIDHRLILTG